MKVVIRGVTPHLPHVFLPLTDYRSSEENLMNATLEHAIGDNL